MTLKQPRDSKDAEIVWIAKWRGRKARISSKDGPSKTPNWIHESGEEVNWRCIKGKEYLNKLATTKGNATYPYSTNQESTINKQTRKAAEKALKNNE